MMDTLNEVTIKHTVIFCTCELIFEKYKTRTNELGNASIEMLAKLEYPLRSRNWKFPKFRPAMPSLPSRMRTTLARRMLNASRSRLRGTSPIIDTSPALLRGPQESQSGECAADVTVQLLPKKWLARKTSSLVMANLRIPRIRFEFPPTPSDHSVPSQGFALAHPLS